MSGIQPWTTSWLASGKKSNPSISGIYNNIWLFFNCVLLLVLYLEFNLRWGNAFEDKKIVYITNICPYTKLWHLWLCHEAECATTTDIQTFLAQIWLSDFSLDQHLYGNFHSGYCAYYPVGNTHLKVLAFTSCPAMIYLATLYIQ